MLSWNLVEVFDENKNLDAELTSSWSVDPIYQNLDQTDTYLSSNSESTYFEIRRTIICMNLNKFKDSCLSKKILQKELKK